VTTSPGRCRSSARIWQGFPCSLIVAPLRRTSRHRRSTSNSPTLKRADGLAGTCMAGFCQTAILSCPLREVKPETGLREKPSGLHYQPLLTPNLPCLPTIYPNL